MTRRDKRKQPMIWMRIPSASRRRFARWSPVPAGAASSHPLTHELPLVSKPPPPSRCGPVLGFARAAAAGLCLCCGFPPPASLPSYQASAVADHLGRRRPRAVPAASAAVPPARPRFSCGTPHLCRPVAAPCQAASRRGLPKPPCRPAAAPGTFVSTSHHSNSPPSASPA